MKPFFVFGHLHSFCIKWLFKYQFLTLEYCMHIHKVRGIRAFKREGCGELQFIPLVIIYLLLLHRHIKFLILLDKSYRNGV